MHDLAEFLTRHPPFDELDASILERLAEHSNEERFDAGTTIFGQGAKPQDTVRVIGSGAVELVDHGRVLDVLGEGELFGHPSMVAALPTGFEARAREDTVCFALPAEDVLALLARPPGLRFLARSLLDRPRPGRVLWADASGFDLAQQRARSLIREPPIVCEPGVSLREAATRMAEGGANSVLVSLGGGELGIVTDRDLRSRVIAAGVSVDSPVRTVMTAPAITIGPERNGADVLMVMLDHGIRHLPVVTARSEILGVISDADLLAAEARTPFALRRAIAAAAGIDDLRRAAERLNPTLLGLHDAGLAPSQISALISVVADALIRRTIELTLERAEAPGAGFAWLAFGSHARREAVPSSDIDSGIVWTGDDDEPRPRALAGAVLETLRATGWESDTHGLTAAGPLYAHSVAEWERSIAGWLKQPAEDNALMALSVVLDHRTVHGPDDAFGALARLRAVRNRAHVLRLLLRLATALRPPTGFLKNFVVEHSGEHRGTLNIKKGGVLPVVTIARYAGHAAGATATSTTERLGAAADGSVLSASEAETLAEAFELFAALRLDHQVLQLQDGAAPDDRIDPRTLGKLTRHHLRDAFRAVAAVQRNLDRELHWSA